jgi:hypothetical protein
MKNIRKCLCTTILGVTLCVPAVRGQEPDPHSNPPIQPGAPLPAGKTIIKAPGETPTTPEAELTTPDTRPLSGAELFTLGQMGKRRNFLLTSFGFLQLADANPGVTSTQSNFEMTSTLLGRIALRRLWSHYEFRTEYRGGGILFDRHSNLDTSVHELKLEQRIVGRRWNFLLEDQLGYLPESSFGFAGLGSGQSDLSTGVGTLNPVFLPNESILTARTNRFSNTVVGQVQRLLGRKSSVTASASYGILRFLGPGFVDNNNANFFVGYDYAPTARNTFALSYGFSLFRFTDQSPQIYDHMVRVGYGRRITGRLALQLSGGPDFYTFNNALTATGQRYSWGQQSALLYDFRKTTTLSITYATYLSGGAGVLLGAQTHDSHLTVQHRLSRIWDSSLDVGFARNTALSETTLPASKQAAFNTWFGNAILTRPVGRYMHLMFDYSIQRQTSNTNLCAITVCGTAATRHVFGFGFDWHHRQIPLG